MNEEVKLPPLPALEAQTERVEVWGLMQDYARAAVLLEREQCAQIAESMKTRPPGDDPEDVERGFNGAIRMVAAAIRAKD